MKARESQCLPHIWQMVVQRGSWSGTHMSVLKYEVDCKKWWKRVGYIGANLYLFFDPGMNQQTPLFINALLQCTWTIHRLAQVELWSILSYNVMHRMWQVVLVGQFGENYTIIWNNNKVFIYTSVCLLWETHIYHKNLQQVGLYAIGYRHNIPLYSKLCLESKKQL